MKVQVTITKTFDFSQENINDLMTTALEGGINYWCRKAIVKDVPKEFEGKYEFASDVISLGGTLELFDTDSSDSWELNLEKFLSGIKRYIEENGYTNVQDLMDDHDADTADCIVQYAIFNELMFC